MVALKKAYAEIILNTAKEAAARVMASEHKALRFQHDLRSTKDESLRVLLRLKQMIDSKVCFFFFKFCILESFVLFIFLLLVFMIRFWSCLERRFHESW